MLRPFVFFLSELLTHAALAQVSSFQIPTAVLCYTSICWHKAGVFQLHSWVQRRCSDISCACGLLVLAVAMATCNKSHCNIQAAVGSFRGKGYFRFSDPQPGAEGYSFSTVVNDPIKPRGRGRDKCAWMSGG